MAAKRERLKQLVLWGRKCHLPADSATNGAQERPVHYTRERALFLYKERRLSANLRILSFPCAWIRLIREYFFLPRILDFFFFFGCIVRGWRTNSRRHRRYRRKWSRFFCDTRVINVRGYGNAIALRNPNIDRRPICKRFSPDAYWLLKILWKERVSLSTCIIHPKTYLITDLEGQRICLRLGLQNSEGSRRGQMHSWGAQSVVGSHVVPCSSAGVKLGYIVFPIALLCILVSVWLHEIFWRQVKCVMCCWN